MKLLMFHILLLILPLLPVGVLAQTKKGGGKAQTVIGAKTSLLDFDRRWQAAATTKNVDEMAALYTADAEWMPPNEEQSSGRNAVRAAYAKICALPDFSLVHTATRHVVAASGETAIEYGVYYFKAKISGVDFKDTGKYLFFLVKENGEWRIAADIFNSDAAPGAINND